MGLLDVLITIIFFLLIILSFCAFVGAFIFFIDIYKWSKRPEKYENFEKDLKQTKDVTVKEVIHNE